MRRIFTRPLPPRPMLRMKAGKIRIGYLSGEFREQATAILMAGLYERHDRTRFEIIAIDNGSADQSPMSTRLETAFDHCDRHRRADDGEAAEKIRAAGIDILVNLNGYFGEHRMGVFAQRPAPVQVNYLGFPGTLGAPYMDYIIADRIVIPEDESNCYDERSYSLPDCYQVNDNRGRDNRTQTARRKPGLPAARFRLLQFQPELQADAGQSSQAGCAF